MKRRELFYMIKTDILRYGDENGINTASFFKKVSIFFTPSVMALAIHRTAHYFYVKNLRIIARFFWTINVFLFAVDIAPPTSIGEYCYFPHPVGCVIFAKIGHRATLFAQVGIGGGRGDEDIGAGKGIPILGDNVTVGNKASVLGSIRVGDGAFIGAASLVIKDVPPHAVVYGVPAKVMKYLYEGESE